MSILVTTDWLAENLHNEDIRIFDCTTLLRPDEKGVFRVESGEPGYLQAHIPGAGYLDLQGSFSDQSSPLRFTLPDANAFAAAAGAHGISNEHHIVLYSHPTPMWATRFWWMFRAFGHQQVSVLDGGLAKWQAEGRPTSTEAANYSACTYQASLDPDRVADKSKMLDAMQSDSTCILNSLDRKNHSGESAAYGRAGHIATADNIPWSELVDPETGCFLPAPELEARFAATGAGNAKQVITYCGGGIAASVDLFALALIGRERDVALYDNSLSEWANDPDLPMET